jgi:integrase
MEQAAQRSTPDTKCLITALRSLLRYLFVTGRIDRELASVVPTVANRRLGSLPARVASGHAELLLDSCRRNTAIGRRDFAILTLLIRLGLRTCEVAAIEVNDIDWRTGVLTVRGKGGYRDELPLPADVGQALIDYLVDGRPTGCATANLLVSACAPWRTASPNAIQKVVARACARVGIPRIGAHRLRHTVASDLLAAGASLAEIGQILRHRSQLSTATYAKIDHARLRTLARPWPAGAR